MNDISRRLFLKGGSAAIVAAGAISALPGVPALLATAESQGPADADTAGAALTDAESSAATSEPVIAHVRDLSTGEIGIFTGTREVTVVNRQLAAALVRSLR